MRENQLIINRIRIAYRFHYLRLIPPKVFMPVNWGTLAAAFLASSIACKTRRGSVRNQTQSN